VKLQEKESASDITAEERQYLIDYFIPIMMTIPSPISST
jgi:hypothetical protein